MDIKTYTQEDITRIITQAKEAASLAACAYLRDKYNGNDQGCCGFAWVNIYGIKGNTKLGKMFKKAGVEQDYSRAFSIWNPSGLSVQNIDTKEAGAYAAAEVFKQAGFTAYAGSRMD